MIKALMSINGSWTQWPTSTFSTVYDVENNDRDKMTEAYITCIGQRHWKVTKSAMGFHAKYGKRPKVLRP